MSKYPNSFWITLGSGEEADLLFQNIEHYRKSMGWTRKRLYLMGAASMVSQDNPNLVLQIAEYLTGAPPVSHLKVEKSDDEHS